MISRKTPLKRYKGVNKKTPKQRSSELNMHKVYHTKRINDDHFCTGCGAHSNLTHSHIISRIDKELKSDSRNITYHCANTFDNDGCAFNWEQVGIRATLLDYKRNMEFIEEVRPLIFRKMIVDDHNFFLDHPEDLCKTEFFNYICTKFEEL